MKKRGLSQILTTVLIILLTLIAIAIIWAYTRSTAIDASEKVYMQGQCFSVSAEMLNCEYGGFSGPPKIWFVTGLVELKEGETTEIRVTFVTEDGKAFTKELQPMSIFQTTKILPATQIENDGPPSYAIASPIVYNQDRTKSLACTFSKTIPCAETQLRGNLCDLPTFIEDIAPFILAFNEPSYNESFPTCDKSNANFNCDDIGITFLDVTPFQEVLINGWILCNQSMICSYVWDELGEPPTTNWWQNGAITAYFNETCK